MAAKKPSPPAAERSARHVLPDNLDAALERAS